MVALVCRTLVVVSLARLHSTGACTTFAAGKMATVDSTVIVSHAEDETMWADPRLSYVVAKDYPSGSKRLIYSYTETFPSYVSGDFSTAYRPAHGETMSVPIGEIPQVSHTFGYHDANFGVINEHNVAIGESTCSAVFKHPSRGEALFNMAALSKIAMERATTARGAVELMGELSTKYGYYGMEALVPGEAVHVGDKTEAWAFQILPDPTGTNAIWVAQRVPDEHVTVLANFFTIREVNVSDTANFLASPNLFSVAEERGWWAKGEKFDFAKMYATGEYGGKYYSGRRMWRGFQLINPSLKLSPTYGSLTQDNPYPFSVKPEKLVTARDFMRWHRDFYEGTDYDMTKGITAGPFGSPDLYFNYFNYTVERSISVYRSIYTHVQQTGGQGLFAGVVWFASGAAHYAAFVPIPSGFSHSLTPFTDFMPQKSSAGSMNWATANVMTVCQARFDKMHQVVQEWQKRAEDAGEELLRHAAEKEPADITNLVTSHASAVLSDWWLLSEELLFRFKANNDIRNGVANLGYPAPWLELVEEARVGAREWWLMSLGVGVGVLLTVAVGLIAKLSYIDANVFL